jgi:uncharacterized protein YbaP (TraB family)
MRKRLVSLLLLISLCFSMLASSIAYAAEPVTDEAGITSQDTGSVQEQQFSPWAVKDLLVGDTYGIYPMSWYEKSEGITSPIRSAQLRVLLAGIRNKLINSGCVVEGERIVPVIKSGMTVEEVINAIYATLRSYMYIGDIGLGEDDTAVSFMAEKGIFTGEEGQLSLSDICTIEQACVIAVRTITHIYDKLDAASKGFLWEAKSGGNTVYMLGSVHLGSYDIYPLSKDILNAYAASDALVVELNILDPNSAAILSQYGLYNDGTTLADHVSEEVYAKVIELAPIIGLSPEYAAYFKPWFLESSFSAILNSGNQAAYDLAFSLGIDLRFAVDAIYEGKPILEVEGYEGQAQVLDSFSDELNEYILNNTLDQVYELLNGKSASSDNLDIILEYWRYGDVDSMKEYIAPSYSMSDIDTVDEDIKKLNDEYVDKMLTQRDARMAAYIDELLQGGGSTTYFVILGSAHYIGSYDVLDILAEKGYEISRIK